MKLFAACAVFLFSMNLGLGQTTYNAFNQFSTTSNPNGAWTYLNGLGTTMVAATNVDGTGSPGWALDTNGDPPCVGTWAGLPAGYLLTCSGTVTYTKSNGFVYAGPVTSILRWTAPSAGNVVLSGSVYINSTAYLRFLINYNGGGITQYDFPNVAAQAVNLSSCSGGSSALSFGVNAGDTIDFINTFMGDTTVNGGSVIGMNPTVTFTSGAPAAVPVPNIAIYGAADEYSSSFDLNGAWSYLRATPIGGAQTGTAWLVPGGSLGPSAEPGWFYESNGWAPYISPWLGNCAQVALCSDSTQGGDPVLRWTAPAAGSVEIGGSAYGNGGASSYNIEHNGTVVSTITQPANTQQAFTAGSGGVAALSFSVGAGDTVDIVDTGGTHIDDLFQPYLIDFTETPGQAATNPGVATLYPDTTIQEPNGAWILTLDSQTAGIQELLDYCFTNNCDGYIVGGDMSTGGAVVYNCYDTIYMPPRRGFKLDTGAITINYTSSLGSSTGLLIDSCMNCDISIRGQSVYADTGDNVDILPTNPVPGGGVGFQGNRFYITTSGASTSALANVAFDGLVTNNEFFFNELNGGAIGFNVNSGTFTNNNITCHHLHGQATKAAESSAVTNNWGNTWSIASDPDTFSPDGPHEGGHDNTWFVTAYAGSGHPSFSMDSTAYGNMCHIMQLGGSGIASSASTPTNRFYITPAMGGAMTHLGYSVSTPGVPASGSAVYNGNTYPCEIQFITAGTGISWSIIDPYGVSQTYGWAIYNGQSIYLGPDEGIVLTYTAAPTWKWRAMNNE